MQSVVTSSNASVTGYLRLSVTGTFLSSTPSLLQGSTAQDHKYPVLFLLPAVQLGGLVGSQVRHLKELVVYFQCFDRAFGDYEDTIPSSSGRLVSERIYRWPGNA